MTSPFDAQHEKVNGEWMEINNFPQYGSAMWSYDDLDAFNEYMENGGNRYYRLTTESVNLMGPSILTNEQLSNVRVKDVVILTVFEKCMVYEHFHERLIRYAYKPGQTNIMIERRLIDHSASLNKLNELKNTIYVDKDQCHLFVNPTDDCDGTWKSRWTDLDNVGSNEWINLMTK